MEKYIFSGILVASLLSMVNHSAPLPHIPNYKPSQQQTLSIGQQIQLLRIRKGFSQKYLARMSGVNLAEISTIEKDNTPPTINTLYKIQEILGGGIIVDGDSIARL